MQKKYIAILAIFAVALSGCSVFNSEESKEVVYPPGIITPKPTKKTEPTRKATPTEIVEPTKTIDEPSITPEVYPSASLTISPIPAEAIDDKVEGDYRININFALVSETVGGIDVKVEGIYTDNCTVGKYSWEIQGTQIMIEIGQPDETKTDCQESTKPYTATIPVNYSFKSGQEYTIVANGFESEPFSIE